ncbi:MAG: 16S rRNA (guanine(966)-N(2))-methyltransferase RsmD [Clostridia bacterium]
MRIISGKYGGRKLFSPKGDDVRPTTDRVKEALFNILQFKVRNAVVLDLFSGSGALGIECVSRGAKEVIFSDNDRKSIELVNRNLSGIEFNGQILQSDYLRVISNSKAKFDIIFLDPPYNSGLAEKAILEILKCDILSNDGIIVYEHVRKLAYTPPEGLFLDDSRKYGDIQLDFIVKVK